MNKLLIICGPTASGKTALALRLAKKFKGELVSADSRQVYRGMNIVTGKDIPKSNIKYQISKIQIKNQKLEAMMIDKIPVWMVDVIDPDERFSVADYYNVAWEVIDDIWKRGKLPILVGGTGFYIKAVVDGIGTMGIAPDIDLRQELSVLPVELLGKKLKKLDPKRWERMNESDRQNPRRLIRAIEISIHLGGVHPRFAKVSRGESATPEVVLRPRHTSGVNLLWIGMTSQKKILYKKIDRRVEERMRQGAVEETKKLAKQYGWNVPSMTGIGYRQLRDYIENKISIEEAVKRWKLAEHEYASKQMIWFKKEKRIAWLVVY